MIVWGLFPYKLFISQIELDLLRTLPDNEHFSKPDSEGIEKLRRVLLAYSLHNPEVEYCQVRNVLIKKWHFEQSL